MRKDIVPRCVSDHCALTDKAFIQRVHAIDREVKVSLFGFHRMRENVYKRVLFPLPDGVVCFALEAGVENNLVSTSYLPILAHTAMLRSSEIDWDRPDCRG